MNHYDFLELSMSLENGTDDDIALPCDLSFVQIAILGDRAVEAESTLTVRGAKFWEPWKGSALHEHREKNVKLRL